MMKKVSIAVSDLQVVLTALEKNKISMEDILALINKKNNQTRRDSEKIIPLIVDYFCTLKQMIANGNYDWNDSNITKENFPISEELGDEKAKISIKLFHFNRGINSENVEKEMDKDGFRPATLFEQLAFAQRYPDLQRQFPIVALGSFWRGALNHRYVPCLDVFDVRRMLFLFWLDSDWGAGYRFLAVRK